RSASSNAGVPCRSRWQYQCCATDARTCGYHDARRRKAGSRCGGLAPMCQKCSGVNGPQSRRLVIDGIAPAGAEPGLTRYRVVAAGYGMKHDRAATRLLAGEAVEHGIEISDSSIAFLSNERCYG